MNTPHKLVFFGTELFSVPTLEALIKHTNEYEIAAIVTKPDAVRGRGKKIFVHPVKQIGIDYGIPVLQPAKLGDLEETLRDLRADAAVLVSYGKIIPKRILSVFEPLGVINIHPSRLPEFRGPSPIEAAIIAGKKETAISIMKLDEGMDTGSIYIQEPVTLTGTETKPELAERLANIGATTLIRVLPDILTGTLTPKPQENTVVSVTSLISKSDGVLDPTTDSATVLERKIRAYQGYPKPHLSLFGNDVIVTSATVVANNATDKLIIPCADETYLEITELVAPSGRAMRGIDFLHGYSKK